MNVLLFVTTMIMVLAMLTYTRLETYRNFSLVDTEFTKFMEITERGYINEAAKCWYRTHQATRQKNPSNKPNALDSGSRLNFNIFINKKIQEANPKAYPELFLLAKKLMLYLYKEQSFFKTLFEQKPDLLDAVLTRLILADDLPDKRKVTAPDDLSTVDLEDPLLNNFMYFVIKGTPVPDKAQEKKEEPAPAVGLRTDEESEESDDDEDEIEPNEKEHCKSPEGFYSLSDYIAIQNAVKVRVFLASRALLMAIFDDKNVVDAIISMRKDLFKKVKKKNLPLDPKEASQQFESAFSSKSDPHFTKVILDYAVTKTNPKDYE
jgi:hypothetical protein